MGQSSRVAPATTARRGLPALRPLLLLGGFVLAWWLLMTGAAQADEGPLGSGRGLGSTTKAVTDKAPADDSAKSPRQATARPAADNDAKRAARPAPVREVQRSVRQVAEPVATPVRTPDTAPARTTVQKVAKRVESTPVKPIVQIATDTVRKTRAPLRPLTNAVHAEIRDLAVQTTPDLPVELPIDLSEVPAPDPPSAVVDRTVAAPAAAVVPAAKATASEHRPTMGQAPLSSASNTSGPLLAGLADPSAAAAPQTVESSVGTPSNELPGSGSLTPLGAIGAGSAGSGSTPTAGAGILDTDTHLTAPNAITVRSTDSDRRPAGPAYPPSCSPD